VGYGREGGGGTAGREKDKAVGKKKKGVSEKKPHLLRGGKKQAGSAGWKESQKKFKGAAGVKKK